MRATICSTLCATSLILSLCLVSGSQLASQTNAETNTETKTVKAKTVRTLQSRLTTDLAVSRDLGDYIPCEFTREDLLQLRPQPEVYALSAADENDLRFTIISDVNEDDSNDLTEEQKQGVAEAISQASFVGLTRSEALSKALSLLSLLHGKDLNQEQATLSIKSSLTNKEYADFSAGQYKISQKALLDRLGSPEASAPPDQKLRALIDVAKATNNTDAAKDSSAVLNPKLSGWSKVADAARLAAAAIGRPKDVGCSMSILSWNTTRYAFGQKIADEYIPIQIVVRNLNANQEFLVQDAEFAVDEDINGRHGRYAAGVDKWTVRTFMLGARDYSKRNLAVHLAQGAGMVLASTSLVYGVALKDASNVYNGGFLNALTTVWPDRGTDQLNLLNDEGFSSYRTERTVVPKSGTAEFVIFIKATQFEEGWWTQKCADNIIMRSKEPSAADQAKCLMQYNGPYPDPKCTRDVGISVDLAARRSVCITDSINVKTVDEGSIGELKYFKPKKNIYRKWSPTSRALFRELSYAVVAGTHISEQSDTTASLSKIDCPKYDNGDLNFEKASSNNLSCDLTGANLDKVQNLKLRNGTDATDTKTANGTVTTSGDSKSAKVAFPMDQLGALDAELYKAYTVTKDGVEAGGNPTLHVPNTPFITGQPSPDTVDVSKLPKQIEIKGYHLDKLKSVQLNSGSTTTPTVSIDADKNPTATDAKFTITSDNLSIAKQDYSGDKSLSMNVIPTPKGDDRQSNPKLTITGNYSSAGGGKTTTPSKSGKKP